MEDKMQKINQLLRETAFTVSALADRGVRKAGAVLETANLNVECIRLERELAKRLQEVGQTVYDTHCGRLTDSALLLEQLKGIDECQLQLQQCRQKIAVARGTQRSCPVCGLAAEEQDQFCRECGTVLESK